MSGKINQTFNPLRGKDSDSVSKAELNAILSQISRMKQDIERSLSSANISTIITQTLGSGGGGGGGTTTGSTVKVVSKAITAGVALAEVFDAPSMIIGRPISIATDSGMSSPEIPTITLETVSGFTATSIQSGVLYYAYVHI